MKLFYFIDWIAPTQGGTKAYCKWCKIELVPKHSILKAHSHTKRHERASPVKKNNSQVRNKKSFEIQLDEHLKRNKRETEVRLTLQQALHGNMNTSNHLIDVLKTLGVAHSSATLKRYKATMIVRNILGPICRKLLMSDLLMKSCSFYIDESTDITGTSFLGKKIPCIFCLLGRIQVLYIFYMHYFEYYRILQIFNYKICTLNHVIQFENYKMLFYMTFFN